jgi:glycosyltransferase involved in cell wall biosynthesis
VKILVVAPMVPRRDAAGAIPLLLDAMLEGLRARHEIALVCVADPLTGDCEAVAELCAAGIEVHAVVTDRWTPRRLRRRWRLATSWLGGAMPFRTGWFWEPGVQSAMDKLWQTSSIDLVTLEDNATGLYRVPRGIPVVLTEYEVRRPRKIDWRSARYGSVRSWLFRELDWQRWPAYQRRVWRRANLIQVLTQRDAAAVSAIAPEVAARVRVNPFGVRLPERPADPGLEDPNELLLVGNFSHPPNVDAAVWVAHEILPRVRAKHPSARLVLVGPEAPGEVRALASEAVEVKGRVPFIQPFFDKAALLLAPVRTGGGQRMKVLQGMAFGKAVVTTSRGAEGLAIDAQLPPLAIAETADSLAEVTIRLLADAEARQALGREARAYAAAHFSPDAYTRRLERIYAELVQ